MTLTSQSFLFFFAASLAVYYLLPKRWQWIELLVFSLLFFHFSAKDYTVLYIVAGVAATAFCARGIAAAKRAGNAAAAKRALAAGLAVNVGLLAPLKYANFVVVNVNRVLALAGAAARLPAARLSVPIGVSFYTLQAVGYLLDVYWNICPPQPGLWKTGLFIGYYPLLTSGPIVRYDQVREQLYAPHRFDFRRVCFGLQRMLWGVFKKLVISARAAVVVNTVYANTYKYDGYYIWIAAAFFAIQLYTDFSGCMDIVIGASECYGIILPENFRAPFFSRSVQEFWQRWHITLGAWMKDYILYPVLRSGLWKDLTGRIKNRWGRKAAKQVPGILGMLCVWLLMGLWHGGSWKFVVGWALWFWGCIALAQILEPVFKKTISFFNINTDCFSWHLFQSARVFALVCVGDMFFRLGGLMTALRALKRGLRLNNPYIFFDGSLFKLGLDGPNFILLAIGIGVLILVSALREKGGLREQIERQNTAFRWILWYGLIFAILIFGMYGKGYNPADFIYRGF